MRGGGTTIPERQSETSNDGPAIRPVSLIIHCRQFVHPAQLEILRFSFCLFLSVSPRLFPPTLWFFNEFGEDYAAPLQVCHQVSMTRVSA